MNSAPVVVKGAVFPLWAKWKNGRRVYMYHFGYETNADWFDVEDELAAKNESIVDDYSKILKALP